MSFSHLHVHTEYSLLDGSNKITEYVSRVKELGMNSAAITDHGVMFGVIDFYKEAKKQGIKPILGCEVYVAPGSRFDKEAGAGGEDRYYHLVLLAENNRGYANLIKLVSRGFTEGYYYKPRVDLELLQEYHEGIIALSACLAGEVQCNLKRGRYEEAKKVALRYRGIFGEENFFLELQDHGLREQTEVNSQQIRLSHETEIPLVATNDIHYTYAEDEKPHDILLCIQTGKRLSDENRMRYEGGQYYVKSEEEMRALFSYAEEAIENTQKIADRCQVEIEFGVTKIPRFDVPKGYQAEEYLRKLCEEGLTRRYGTPSEELQKRLAYELNTIEKMGYVDYFLIVWDFLRYAREKGISVGPGRGSAAGSLVSYSLDITSIDPMQYQLLFERFLNPERISMPDIDIDFCYERRQEVIDYVVKKYGREQVAQIVTFGTMAARGVLRDVGRVMDLPYAFVDHIAKMVPSELNMTLERALQMNPELRKLYEEDLQVRELIDMSKRLEGLPRHTSMHAAGVVISQKAVEEYVPLSLASDGSVTTQFPMTTLEELGLLKMDFLGLRTLTVIQTATELIKQSTGKAIQIEEISYQDQKVLESLGTGKNDGVFQLESPGMKNFMKELKPQSLEDIIAGISLYRPGPMEFIPQYIQGKNHPEEIVYDCPELEPILSATYGCIVYQEQVMQIVRDLAGYTLGRSDLVRRAMSKKKGEVMERERQNFVYGNPEEGVPGCVARGIEAKKANRIYDNMIDFAKYAFNKSHAAAYAMVSYQTAWLKYYYPVEFMAALMTSVTDNSTKVAEYIYSGRQMGIQLLPPDINKGEGNFGVDHGCIRYGLAAIKSVGKPVIDSVVAERNANGLYLDMKDFIKRLSGREVNKRTLESLIKAGAFDEFQVTRKQLMEMYPQLLEQVARERKSALTGQMSLFEIVDEEQKKKFDIRLPDRVEEYTKEERLAFEKEMLGVYLSGHPLEEYERQWRLQITATSVDFSELLEDGRTKVREGAKEVVGGLVTEHTVKYTKTDQVMAFITLEDMLGTMEIVVFPRMYEKYRERLEMEQKVFIFGHVSEEDERASKLICEEVILFEEVPTEIWVQFADKEEYLQREKTVKELLQDIQGTSSVRIYCKKERAVKSLGAMVRETEAVKRLAEVFGIEQVKVRERAWKKEKK